MQTKARITACRHLETFDLGTAYIYKCDLLVSVMLHDVWLMKLTRRSHLYMKAVPGSKVSRCLQALRLSLRLYRVK